MKIVFSDNTFQDNSRVGYDYCNSTAYKLAMNELGEKI
jgi:hypothetical protein